MDGCSPGGVDWRTGGCRVTEFRREFLAPYLPDQWSAQTAVEGHEKVVRVEERVTVLEAKLTRLYAAVGEHRLKWGIVAWVVGTAGAAAIAVLARE